MSIYKTEQEEFWANGFGDEYIKRNQGDWLVASNMALFSSILKSTRGIKNIIEFGANIGMNIKALEVLLPTSDIDAVEINKKASGELKQFKHIRKVFNQSILDFNANDGYDFVFTKGVLIHIEPNSLDLVYEKLYQASKKYICMIEYYNPTPVELSYRGNSGKMYKRDFAGEIMQKYSDLELVDYGFVYKNDPIFLQGDLTWFLMEKRD